MREMPSSLTRHDVFQWFTTPEDLRILADEMEAFWKTAKLGHDLTVRTIWGKDAKLAILVDQGRVARP